MSIPWVSVAALWLEENTPCDKELALTEVTKRMPLGIRRGKKVKDTSELAQEAIQRFYKIKFRELPRTLPRKIRKIRKGVTADIRRLAARPEGLTIQECTKMKNGMRLLYFLIKANEIIREGDLLRFNKKEHSID